MTKWIYQDSTGLLTQKQDAALKGASYTYDELSRIKIRTWARGITSTYNYDPNTGEEIGVGYSDSTPAVTFAYDRGGRQSTLTDAAGAHARTFIANGELQTEQISGGILDGINLNIGYDGLLRRNSLQSSSGLNVLSNQTYGYDPTGRLQTVTNSSQTATYGYYPNSGLLNTTSFTSGTQTSRGYDSQGRLQTISTSTPALGVAASYAYVYNNLNQRTRVAREDNSYWLYSYNDRGELVSGKKYWADNAPVWGAQTENNFDNIGNRTSKKEGGNQLNQLRQSGYTTNSLNQYTQRTVPGAVDVTGAANSAATVSVNDQATVRKGDYFYKELAVSNAVSSVYQQITVVGARQNFGAGGEDAVTQQGGHVFVPQAVESFTYDFDGNLTSDGRWNFTWDAENRLVSMEAIPAVPAEAKQRLEFVYDGTARRIQKKVHTWDTSTSTYQLQSTTKFVYDGWSLIAEIDSSNNLVRSYVRGGGELLLVNGSGNTYQVGYDGNQNVGVLVKVSTGTVSASYDYDPFGQTVKAVGEYSSLNAFRFSSEYTDIETGLIYYGYRYYNPQTGRWIGVDPAGEDAGLNLYQFNFNDSINRIDGDGRVSVAAVPFAELDPLRIKVTQEPKRLNKLAAVQYKVRWRIANKDSGWIIQHLKVEYHVFDATGKKLPSSYPNGLEYWEGWQVVNGNVFTSFASIGALSQGDTFETPSQKSGTKGTLTLLGKVKFMKNYILTVPPWGKSFPEAGDLPSRGSSFAGWNESDAHDHNLIIKWDFCKSPGKVWIKWRP